MRYELWVKRDGEWMAVYFTNHYEFAVTRAKWSWCGWKAAIFDREDHVLTML